MLTAGIGDVGNVVLRDRKHLSEDGLIVVVVTVNQEGNLLTEPEVITRGFVYVKESESLIDDIRDYARELFVKSLARRKNGYSNAKNIIKDELGSYLYQRTKRSPMILTVVIEIPKGRAWDKNLSGLKKYLPLNSKGVYMNSTLSIVSLHLQLWSWSWRHSNGRPFITDGVRCQLI